MAGFCKGEYLGYSSGDEPLTLTRCYSCGLSQLYETISGGGFSVARPTTYRHKVDIFLSFTLFCILTFAHFVA